MHVQQFGVESAHVVVRQVHEGHVGRSGPQQAGLLAQAAHVHVHVRGGGLLAVPGQDLREQVGVGTGLGREHQPRFPFRGAAGALACGGCGVEYLASLVQQDLARRGEPHATPGALEQRYAHPPFELLDRPGQRRLGHAQPLGGPADVLLLADRDEVRQLTGLQPFHTRRVSVADPGGHG